tara:strand:- start:393 stop:1628 length:1236 start_codon:yes stop_codon:yes gene_type:complete
MPPNSYMEFIPENQRLKGKKILYITEIFHPASGGGEKATYEHLLRLHNEGAVITVITATPDYSDSTHIYPFEVIRVAESLPSSEYTRPDLIGQAYVDYFQRAGKVIDIAKSYPKDYFDYLFCYGRYGPLTLGPNVFQVIDEYFNKIITVSLQYDPMPSIGTSWKHGIDRGHNLTVLGSPVLVDTWDNISNTIAVVPFINREDLPGTSIVPWEDRPYDFGFINPTHHKGFNTVLKLISSMPDKKFIIKPGGYHHSVVIDKLEKWFPNVTVGGWYKSINEFYQQCKCILYPSLWEGFGMVPMEAASNGCLVFANDHPIIRDANPDFPVFIDAYTEEATDNWLTYFNKVPDMEKDSMYMSAAEDWKDEIIDILGDNKLIDKHISLGFDAMGKHKVREDTLWEAYLERLLILKEV